MEEWKDIEGYEGLYQVSNKGNVRSLYFGKTKVLALVKSSDKNYWTVGLYLAGKKRLHRVHDLVARAFPEICGEWFDGAVVNHKDENGLNNDATNLEVCTIAYNTNYGTGKLKMGDKHKVPVNQYTKDGKFIKQWPSALDAQKATGISRSCISSCCHGRKYYKAPGGYVWRFAE